MRSVRLHRGDLCVAHSSSAKAEVNEAEALLAGHGPIAVLVHQIEEQLRLTSAASGHSSSSQVCSRGKDCYMQSRRSRRGCQRGLRFPCAKAVFEQQPLLCDSGLT